MDTYTLNQAIQMAPAIAATEPSPVVSDRYSFINTGEFLEKAIDSGWTIRDVRQGRNRFGMHKVDLIQTQYADSSTVGEGMPQISIINSHDRSKRFQVMMGFFRLVCSNGLVVATGANLNIRAMHRFGDDKLSTLMSTMEQGIKQFSVIGQKVDQFRDRILSQEEKNALARFAHYIRFRYRQNLPTSIKPDALLGVRRDVDQGDDLWRVYNTIQENMTHGGHNLGKGLTRLEDDTRFNSEFWMGAEKALVTRGTEFEHTLKALFPKKERA